MMFNSPRKRCLRLDAHTANVGAEFLPREARRPPAAVAHQRFPEVPGWVALELCEQQLLGQVVRAEDGVEEEGRLG